MLKNISKIIFGFVTLLFATWVSGAVVPVFAAGLTIDKTATTNQTSATTTIQSPAFTTTQTNEVLYAFITSDGPSANAQSFSSVTGGGLTWNLVKRVNTRAGTSEIWSATATSIWNNAKVTATRSRGSYTGSISVVSFIGADRTTIGATGGGNGLTGAPTASLTTTRDGSWVYGVGNDWDGATSRTVGTNQGLVNQFLSSAGDTFWVQRQNAMTPTAGTSVTINDTDPTNHRWNLATVEILPAPLVTTPTPTATPTPNPTATPTAIPTPTNTPTATPTPTQTVSNKPILVVTTDTNQFSKYYPEILKAEGMNSFDTTDIGSVSASTLANYDVVILGEMPLTSTQVTTFTNWVNAGGNLIAMKPDKQLVGLLGLTDASATLTDKYLLVNTAVAPGAGIVNQTIQFHSTADLYTLNGATAIANFYSDATTATTNPAVTSINVGNNGGHAAAFTYDLAKSIIYTRQGNPAWAGQERDGQSDVIRPDDMFYPDYVDLNKVQIPQADEQQRLLANMITQMDLSKKPLPRFWYLPNGQKAAIVYTLDDHNTASGTKDVFNKFAANSPAGCSVIDWQCLRGTSWFFLGVNLTDSEAASYSAQGFEMGAHVENGCTNFTSLAQLNQTYTDTLSQFQTNFPSLPQQTTHRYHCIVWSDWASQAKAELAHNIRYSMDYYYWPPAWVNGRPGLFTGSGIPMKFADTDGSIIDVYQGVSQLVNENGINYDTDVSTLVTNAIGAKGYYGFFGTHDDYRDSTFSDSIINASKNYNVPVITAKQALTWLDGRNNSAFSAFSWNGNTLTFTITPDAGAHGIQAMLPVVDATNNAINNITVNGSTVPFTTQTIKGVQYAFFPATAGQYTATYNGVPSTPTPTPQNQTLSIWDNAIIPGNASANDTNAVEVGVKFTSDVSGLATGIKFYKGTGNTGTHTGHLWTTSGTLLGTVTFSNESATGWQTATFDTPIALSASTTYIVSYYAPNGHYAADTQYFTASYDNAPLHALSSTAGGGNGIYSYGPQGTFPTSTFNANNYWVDILFQQGSGPVNTPTPTVAPTATPIPTAGPTATPTPTPATILSTIWSNAVLPANPQVNDPNAVSLGVKFTSDVAGKITGIRFYKGAGNTGTHTGSLWSSTGTRLATVTFTNETTSGWQEADFATPVTITANTTYIASYFAPNGNYAGDNNYFATAFDNAPLHALANGTSGGNGIYLYGSDAFPTNTYQSSNYWVDVVFQH